MSHEIERDFHSNQTDDLWIEQIATRLRAGIPVTPDFDDRVMAAVRAEPPSLWRRMTHFAVRPWWAGAALAVAAALVVLLVRGRLDTSVTAVARTATSPTRTDSQASRTRVATAAHRVRFEYVSVGAEQVYAITIVGSFNGWDTTLTPLRRVGPNHWATDVPLVPGRYTYQFVINGKQWIPDPRAPKDAGADFGSSNSVVTVPQGGII